MFGKRQQRSMRLSAFMMMLMGIVAISMWYRGKSFARIPYLEHMEDTAVTIDGREYMLKDLAFYLADQESMVQSQAKTYDPEQPEKYWNAHTNGSFIRLEARDALIAKAVHDTIFYEMAQKDNLVLTEEETVYMENQKMDFWNDLDEEGQERLGVSEEEIGETFLHMALAQKKQRQLAEEKGLDDREYNVDGNEYQRLLAGHTYEINEKLWKRLNFGNITVN